MRLRLIILISLLIIGCSSTPMEPRKPFGRFIFEAPISNDLALLQGRKEQLEKASQKIDAFWNVTDDSQVTIELKPFRENPTFLNCARTYGPHRIYIHSPTSIREAPAAERAQLNPSCLMKSEEDVATSVLHEYVHTRHLLLLKERGTPPQWIWEGLAVYLSAEVTSASASADIDRAMRGLDAVNLCKDELDELQSYKLAPYILAYF